MSSVTRNQENANGSHVRILKSAPNLQTLNFTKGGHNKGNDCDSLYVECEFKQPLCVK